MNIELHGMMVSWWVDEHFSYNWRRLEWLPELWPIGYNGFSRDHRPATLLSNACCFRFPGFHDGLVRSSQTWIGNPEPPACLPSIFLNEGHLCSSSTLSRSTPWPPDDCVVCSRDQCSHKQRAVFSSSGSTYSLLLQRGVISFLQ